MTPLQLPAPLVPWAPFLELLPVESALALGPLLQRLDNWIGPLRVSPESGSVEPDGFDGLARRGSPERLLLSEWLMLEEAPLEFLRRLSQSESAYFQLARRDPHTARASLAVFDCGPNVLGGPRLVQLAALLVLARRAQSAGATFRWGVWQKPGEWRDGVNRENVEWWLSLRTEDEPSVHHRAAWEEVWEGENADWSRDELWLVGSPELAPFVPPRARLLEVQDELDPFAANRAVEAHLSGRTLRLELPGDKIGARLLRDPFAQAAPKTNDKNTFDVVPLDIGLTWGQSGWKLFARTRSGDLMAFSVPNSPSATVGAPKVLRPSKGGLVAAGRVGRSTVAISLLRTPTDADKAVLYFQWWGRGSDNFSNGGALFKTPVGDLSSIQAAPLGQVFGMNNGQIVGVLLSTGRFAVSMEKSGFLKYEEASVLGAALSSGNISVLKSAGEGTGFHTLVKRGDGFDWQEEDVKMPCAVHRAFSGWGGQPNEALWAMQIEEDVWHLRTRDRRSAIHKVSRPVVGCVFNDGPGLLLHTPGERELWFCTPNEESKLFRFSSLIQAVAVCPFAPLIAVQSHDEVGVWSLAHGIWLLRARTE